MTISVLVCTRNRSDRLQQCLTALLRMNLEPVREIVVVDQSDRPLDPSTTPLINHSLIRYYWFRGRGLAKARNQAIYLARGDILAFTDDDCLVTEDWAQKIEQAFMLNPRIDGVLGRVCAYDDGSLPVTYQVWKTDFGEIDYAFRSDGFICNALITKNKSSIFNSPVMPIENVGSGNNMAFRREAFKRHGLFIEILGTGTFLGSGEDLEFHWRLLRRGGVLLYNPSMLVYHNNWLSPDQNSSLHHEYAKGVIAVSIALAIKRDLLAWRYLWFRCKASFYELLSVSVLSGKNLDKPKLHSYYARRIQSLLKGLLGGILLAICYHYLIPKLN